MSLTGRLLCCCLAAISQPACNSSPSHTVHVCARGDRSDLRAKVQGGLEVIFVGAEGEVLGRSKTAADDADRLGFDVPEGTVGVTVKGLDAAGREVAVGEADLGQDQSCVCLALLGQRQAACEAVSCIASSGNCAFVDSAAGEAIEDQTLIFGDNAEDDVQNVTTDTFVRGDSVDNFGRRESIFVSNAPEVGLLRFDLSALPRSSRVEEATLQLYTVNGTSEVVTFFRALEQWDQGGGDSDEGCANWTCRTNTDNWSTPGVGAPDSRQQTPIGTLPPPKEVDTTYRLEAVGLNELVGQWVSGEADNFGLVLTTTGDVKFASSEGLAGHRPRLVVRYTLP